MYESKLTVTLPDGTVISGTQNQVNSVMKAMGLFVPDGVHYKSSHLGIVRIVDMETNHLRNALMKLYRDWLTEVAKQPNTEMLRMLQEGPRSVTVLAMVKELRNRV